MWGKRRRRGRGVGFARALAVCFALAIVAAPAILWTGPRVVRRAAAGEKSWPFAVGESLHYKLGWAAFANAADVRVDFVERRELGAVTTLHFRASLHSLAPLRSLFPVDDIFDSYSDARTLEARQYEFHLDELGEKDTKIRRLATTATMRSLAAPRVIVPAGTRDPLGVLYEMRTVHWKSAPEYRARMYDGNDVFEVRAHVEVASETIAVDAGDFRATKIEARLFQNGVEVPKTVFTMWFAEDAARTPVMLDAMMPYGRVKAELQGK